MQERQQLEKEATDVMDSLLLFMEEKCVVFFNLSFYFFLY